MLKTGVSRAELLGITWADVDFDNKTVSINKDIIDNYVCEKGSCSTRKVPTKNKFRTRTVAIDDETVAFLKKYRHELTAKHDDSKYIVHNKEGKMCSPRTWSRSHYDMFMREMQEFYSYYGVHVPIYTPHCLRHTRATLYMNEGVSPAAIIAQMGWSDTKMLNRVYGHRDIAELRKLLGM